MLEDTKKYVDDFYRKIAEENKVSDEEKQRAVAYSLGYTDEDIELGGDLGLGCGNPLQNARLKEGEWLLDLGSGKGVDVFKAARELNGTGKAVGIDRLSEMIEKAKAIRDKRHFDNADFKVSDIDDIEFDDNTFDIVISNCVINLLPDKEKVYREIFRVLKPGGRVSISDIIQIKKLPAEIISDPIFHATWVGGSITSVEVNNILEKVGFMPYTVIEEDLTDEYLNKWGHKGLDEFIKRGKILAIKPKE